MRTLTLLVSLLFCFQLFASEGEVGEKVCLTTKIVTHDSQKGRAAMQCMDFSSPLNAGRATNSDQFFYCLVWDDFAQLACSGEDCDKIADLKECYRETTEE